jgi:MFS family permease
MLPLAGWLAGRTGRPVLQAALGLAGMAVLPLPLAWLPPGVAAGVLLAVLGVVGGLAGTPIFSLVAQVLPPAARALGMGAFYVVFYLAMALAPPLAGWARDASGDPAAPLWVAAACALLALMAVLAFPRLATRGRVAAAADIAGHTDVPQR